MPKAFLSHSSKDKGFVEVIAKRLGKANIVYDAMTFEEGNKSIDEIMLGLNESDLFVFFISGTALESSWVKKEVIQAKDLHQNGYIKRIYPIIVDKALSFDDKRIPKWLKEYNLRYVSKPSKVAERVLQKLKQISWELYPINKEKEQLFIGRHQLKKNFQERLFNFELPTPNVCIASGFEGIGRKKFFINSLKETNQIKEYYKPLYVLLHSRTSIEDFILGIYDLGYTDSISKEDLIDFLKIPLEEKVELAKILLMEIHESDNKIFIVDNYSIVNSDGTIVDWFLSLVKELRNAVSGTFLFLISLSKVNFNSIRNNDFIYPLIVPELDKPERNNLFQALLDIDKQSVYFQDKKKIADLFTGFPVQIKFAVDYIKNEGVQKLMNNLHEIVDYNSEIVSKSIQRFDKNEKALDLLKILSDYEFISINFLDKIYSGLPLEEQKLLTEFTNTLMVDYFGASSEYLRLNDGIRDYIRRTGRNLPLNISENLRAITEEGLQDYSVYEYDLSEFNITIQEAFVRGKKIPEKYLIPSHFLLAMRELYDNHKKFSEVIELADRALNSYSHLDSKIKNEIQKWLCLALARKRDTRLLKEVQKVDGPDHNFLLAFYYRLIRKFDKALERLIILREEHPNFYRAKRELVQVYVNIEEFEHAYVLAKENYENDKNNPFHIQSYIRCILRKKDEISDIQDLISRLLNQLRESTNEKGLEMYYTSKAQYETFYLEDRTLAMETIEKAIELFPDNFYPYLIKLDISRKFFDAFGLRSAFNAIDENFKDNDFVYRLSYLSCKAIYLALNNKLREANNLIESRINPHFPNGIGRRLKEELTQINTGHNILYK